MKWPQSLPVCVVRPLLHGPPEEDPAAEARDRAVVEVVDGGVATHAAHLAQGRVHAAAAGASAAAAAAAGSAAASGVIVVAVVTISITAVTVVVAAAFGAVGTHV